MVTNKGTIMKGYLGEIDVTGQHDLDPKSMALLYITKYSGIDGSHHKDWVLDQIARVLNGAPITVREARWDNGYTELRYTVGTCKKYEQWVTDMRSGEDGPETYSYEIGIAP